MLVFSRSVFGVSKICPGFVSGCLRIRFLSFDGVEVGPFCAACAGFDTAESFAEVPGGSGPDCMDCMVPSLDCPSLGLVDTRLPEKSGCYLQSLFGQR